MLTKDEILILPRLESEREVVELTFGDWLSVQDQAISAIDLDAEIDRLKAKLDAVRAECLKPIMITSDVFGGGVAAGHNILKQAVLAIIKDGDKDA